MSTNRSKRTSKPKPAMAKDQKPPADLTNAVIASRIKTRNKSARPVDLFKPAAHPPQTTPTAGSMAMDSSLTDYSQWAQSAVFGAIEEGQAFLGYPALSYLALRTEYRRAAEAYALHMTRKWIEIKCEGDTKGDTSKEDRIKQIKDEFTRLNVQQVIAKMIRDDKLFGRSHVYIDLGTTDNPAELQTDIGDGTTAASRNKIGIGSLKRLIPVEAVWCYPTQYESSNPLKESWYKPSAWQVMANNVHKSRLLMMVSNEVPDLLKPAFSFGGVALSQMIKPYVDNWLRTRQSVADLVESFSVMVLKTDVINQLAVGAEENLFKRIDVFNNTRNNRGSMVVDRELEDLTNVSAPLGGLDQLQAQSQEHISAASGIPLVFYVCMQPAGLNASSQGEIESFYDLCASLQERDVRPVLDPIFRIVQLSLWGEVDPAITYDFVPLKTMTETEETEIKARQAAIDAQYIESHVITEQEVRKRLASDPDSGYSIDADMPDDGLPEPPNPDLSGLNPGVQENSPQDLHSDILPDRI